MADSLMESRGQKRPEIAEELPADKRACNSLDVGPSSSFVGLDMETSSSSASASAHSEGDAERDSPRRSFDSDDMDEDDHRFSSLRDLQRSRSYSDSAKFDRILSSLNNDAEPSGQLAALTELCELISFCTGDTLSSVICDRLASALVKLAKHESNPDIMLLSIRALTYLCDVYRRLPSLLVRHNAIPALCQRLMVIEYLDVAEQCLQALEKISHDQPRVCLQSGAITAVLGYIDFFSTTVQRTALRTVANICKVLSSECPSPVMEAVPRLCNMLQYEDQQLVELVASCLIKVGECVKDSPGMLTELYNHGLVNQVIRLIDLNGRITLSQTTFTGLVGLVAKIASGSADAVKTLFELEIGRIVKDVLSNSELSHGTPSPRTMDNNCRQVHEILKLLHELLPEVVRDKNEEQVSTIETFLLEQSETLQKFGMDILPTMVQVVSAGANLSVCYGCLSVVNRLIYVSKAATLLKMFEAVNISSFLAGIFTQNDHHVLLLALQIAETVLEKLANNLRPAFIKEGVLFAIDNLLMPNSCSHPTSPIISNSGSKKTAGREVVKCFCFIYRKKQPESNIDSKTCKASKDSIHTVAEHIKMNYFFVESDSSQSMVTDLLQDLRNASQAINNVLNLSPERGQGAAREETLGSVLKRVILQLGGNVPVSTFELIESGIIKALLNYLTNGQFASSEYIPNDQTHAYNVQKRFEAFARISLSSPDPSSQDLPLSSLVRKLLTALSTVETFPVIASYEIRQRGSYATVPCRRSTMHPCLKVLFVRGEEDACLGDYLKEAVSVDPFCLVEEIEQFLLPKVIQTKMDMSENTSKDSLEAKAKSNPTDGDKSGEHMGSESNSIVLHHMQEEGDGKSHCSLMETSDLGQTTIVGAEVTSVAQSVCTEEEIQSSCATENLVAASIPSKLVLFLDGEQLENSSTLYQEILQRRMKLHNDLQNDLKFWCNTYTITYRRVAEKKTRSLMQCQNICNNGAEDRVLRCREVMPIFSSIFTHGLGSKLDSASPSSDILLLLRSLEIMNRFSSHLISCEGMNGFVDGMLDKLDELKVALPRLSQYEFVSSRLTEKLEQQMRDPSVVHVGAMPLWCNQLIAKCPFLFSFEARCKYFQLAAFGKVHGQLNKPSHGDLNSPRERRVSVGSPSRKKFLVCRERILESASQMMDLYAQQKVVVEVEYSEEVGTGLGPTLEFYTLVSHEFQKSGLGMWRGDHVLHTKDSSFGSTSGLMVSTSGLFPRPCSPALGNLNGVECSELSEVINKFCLLGKIVGKALQDGRVLDIPFSVAFYKLVLGKEVSLCDILSFDPELGRTLLEFKALSGRWKSMELACDGNIARDDCLRFQGTKIEDLCLDFTLPGYPDYVLSSGMDGVMVDINNLEVYISLVLDATLHSGVARQVEAFKSGLNQVIPIKYLEVFTEEELERLLCGERDSWISTDLFDHIKFDHGYTASSPPILDLLDVISEFTYEQRRAFLQFVTGAPRLPPGGLAALNPNLTIVRKHSSNCPDTDLPSVMTCANYLKLPPYSSKDIMKAKLLYAITEGQGSFHLS